MQDVFRTVRVPLSTCIKNHIYFSQSHNGSQDHPPFILERLVYQSMTGTVAFYKDGFLTENKGGNN